MTATVLFSGAAGYSASSLDYTKCGVAIKCFEQAVVDHMATTVAIPLFRSVQSSAAGAQRRSSRDRGLYR